LNDQYKFNCIFEELKIKGRWRCGNYRTAMNHQKQAIQEIL